jgi:predicted RNA binding protein YcfA (HicA-like mRNA interferase family)
MKSVSGRELARLVERHGWQLLRINGSHHIYGKAGSIVRLSIPIHWQQGAEDGIAPASAQGGRDRRKRVVASSAPRPS